MLAVIAQMRLQSVQGGSIARLSDRISVSLRTRLIKIDQHFFFLPFFPSHVSTFIRAHSTLIQTVAPLFNSSSPKSLSFSVHPSICGSVGGMSWPSVVQRELGKRGLEGGAGGSQTRLKERDDVREVKLQLRWIKTQSGGEEVGYAAT